MSKPPTQFAEWIDRTWIIELLEQPPDSPLRFERGQILLFSEEAGQEIEIKDPKKAESHRFDCRHDDDVDQVVTVIASEGRYGRGREKLLCDIARVIRSDKKKSEVLTCVFEVVDEQGRRIDEEIGSWVAVDGQGVGGGDG